PRSVHRWFYLPSRVALFLGLGALSATGARADAPETRPDGTMSRGSADDVLIRSEGEKIYFSEARKGFRELRVKDTAEARYLKQLLDENNGTVVRVDPMTVADSGAGFMWPMPEKAAIPDKTASPESATLPPKNAKRVKESAPPVANTSG